MLMLAVTSCTDNPAGPSPVLQSETLTGTLQPAGVDFKNFNVAFTAAPTQVSVIVNSLVTVAGSAPVTGITIGVGFGSAATGACSVASLSSAVSLGQEVFAPNGAVAGPNCVAIFDCPAGVAGCTPRLTEPVTYNIRVTHF